LKLHLDTDFAGDPDDACALAMLLGWPDVEIVGITTSTDPGGRRAGYVRTLLELAGRDPSSIPIAAGAEVCLTTRRPAGEIPDHDRFWGVPTAPLTSGPGAALNLLAHSVAGGATVVTIGPFTNLGLLEVARPGLLAGVPVVTMGGWTSLPPDGFPAWEAAYDFNVQSDVAAADAVFRAAGNPLTVVGLDVTVQVHLRGAHLDRLRDDGGPVGEVLARSSLAHGTDDGNAAFGAKYPRLPDDLVNYHHDPLACAVAVGWDGVTVEERRLAPILEDGALRLVDSPDGRPVRLVTAVDADAFAERWLDAVTA
jgi:inosine-uridine nucleoside N-ribohydrolase